MRVVRVSVLAASLAVPVSAFVALPAGLTSAGCGSSGSAGGGSGNTGESSSSGSVPPFIPPFSAGESSSGGASGPSSGVSPGTTGTSPGGSSSGPHASTSSPACVTNTGAITGSVTNSGGSVSRLVFAAVGDTRPASEDDTSGYPTSIITTIFKDIQAQSPRPVLAVGTGDYQFSEASGEGTGAQQVQLFMQARQGFSNPFFPAMGNHECGVSGSFTTSDNNDCGPGNPGGSTINYNAFIDYMAKPITGQTLPYYSVNVNATDMSWTSKFVITAANAWNDAQQTWLEGVLKTPTTYTFVVRHEASDAMPPLPTGVAGVDALLTKYPYTLLIVGHTHDYGHYSDAPQTVVFGNGGAPLSSTNYDYGYGLFSQRCDGAIVVQAFDYKTGEINNYDFPFAISPTGTILQ